jgi:hypothetical protein
MLTEAEVKDKYEEAIKFWAYLLVQNNSMYEAYFHQAFAYGDMLQYSGYQIGQDMAAAKHQAERYYDAQL